MAADWRSPFDTGQSLISPDRTGEGVGRARETKDAVAFAVVRLVFKVPLFGFAGLVFLFLLVLWGDGAFTPFPSLLASQSSSFDHVAEPEFQRRLETWHPPGSSASDLVAALVRQGFEISPDRRSAQYRISAIVCVDEASVVWEADEVDRLAWVRGWFHSVCL